MRIWCVLLALLEVPLILMQLVMLLDSGNVGALCTLIFSILVMCIILNMGNYKKRFLKPLLASIPQELPTEESRQEFARQMQTQAVCISYQPRPQTKACEIMVATDYCYVRQPQKSRIFKNNQIRRAVLSKEDYTAGYRWHIRKCYAVALYCPDQEKPIWKGYFMNEAEAFQALMRFQSVLPPEAVTENLAANPPKTARWKTVLNVIIYFLFLAALIFLAIHSRS